MKALNILGATALVASTLTLVAAPEAKAASVFARNGEFSFDGTWQFDYNSSYGGYTSGFGIGPATSPANAPSVIEATGGNVPGSCTTCSMTYNFGAKGVAQFFYDSNGQSRIFSGVDSSYPQTQNALGNQDGFLVLTYAKYLAGDAVLPGSYLKSSVDATPYKNALQNVATTYFSNPANRNGVVIGINDQWTGDSDYQDMILTGKAVPVPALVPGLALAAAFLGYRSKRQAKSTKA